MNTKDFIKGLLGVFSNNTGCNIQYANCPCNTCFHAQEGNFNHICWLIVLGLRGDYADSRAELLDDISKELAKGDENDA